MRAAWLVLLAGCGAGAPISIENFVESYANAACSAQARCVPRAAYLDQQCRRGIADLFAADLPKAIAAGRIVLDSSRARECIDTLASATCVPEGTAAADFSPCLAALQGHVSPGGECSSLFECAAGLCQPESGCPAKCPAVLDEGAACSAHAPPECDVRKGLVCAQGVCRRPAAWGAPCELNSECQNGLICAGGRCAPLRRAYAGCASDASCAPGLFCSGGESAGECRHRAGAGGPCGRSDALIDAALRGAECAQGLQCVGAGLKQDGSAVGGTCAAPAGPGGPCRNEDEDMQIQITGCIDGLICAAGLCVEPPETGPCAKHETCKSGVAWCDLQSSQCLPIRREGAACAHDYECGVPSHQCSNGICTAVAPLCHEP